MQLIGGLKIPENIAAIVIIKIASNRAVYRVIV